MQLGELKSRVNKMKDYRKKIETQAQQQDSKARELGKAGQKSRAIIALKHKKFMLKELEKVDNATFFIQ